MRITVTDSENPCVPCTISWVLDSDSDFFGVFGQIHSKSIFKPIFGGREGFRWVGIAIATILGLVFSRMDSKSVPNRVKAFSKTEVASVSGCL